jgi:glycosyltransferase involved in cell wall biosynthesis
VLASRLGSMSELVTDGVNGLQFEPGNEADLAAQVAHVIADGNGMRTGARQEFEDKYTADRNYPALMSVYEAALNRATGRLKRKTAPDQPHATPALTPTIARSFRE